MQSGEYKGFKLDIFQQETADIIESLEWENIINIPYGKLKSYVLELIGQVTITYKNGTNYRYDNTSYDFYFTFTNQIGKDGYIVLSLHNDFLTIATNCTINSGFELDDMDSILCGKFGTDSTIITIKNFTVVDGH